VYICAVDSAPQFPRSMYRPVLLTEFPSISNVKVGIAYGPSNSLVGTYISTPTPSEVAAAVWDYARTSATASGSMGERLKDAATVATTGAQISGFGE